MALEILKEGNERFVNNIKAHRNLLEQVNETSSGQFPFATILSCIDSRISAELIFDQGLGDIFSIRIAGNIVNDDILGSMEFACKVSGSKLIVVLGHNKCSAIEAACNKIELGNFTSLLDKIKPAINNVLEDGFVGPDEKELFKQLVSIKNIFLTTEKIRMQSKLLSEMEQNGKIKIIRGFYDIDIGKVTFYE